VSLASSAFAVSPKAAQGVSQAVSWRHSAVFRARRLGRFSREVARQARHSVPPAVWARPVPVLPLAASAESPGAEREGAALLGAAEGPRQAVRDAVAALRQVALAAGEVLRPEARDAAVLLREVQVAPLAARLWEEVLLLVALPLAALSHDLVRLAPARQRSEMFVHVMPSLRIASPSKLLSRAARDAVLS
jgi:hypothetical protein